MFLPHGNLHIYICRIGINQLITGSLYTPNKGERSLVPVTNQF